MQMTSSPGLSRVVMVTHSPPAAPTVMMMLFSV